MHEKLREAAAALREAAQVCLADATRRAATYTDLADRLDAVAGANLQPPAAAPAAKRSTPRRGAAPKAGRKVGGNRRGQVKTTIAVGPNHVKPNGQGGHPEAAPEPEKAAPASDVPRTPAGKMVRGALDTHVVKHVGAHPGMKCSELARVFGTSTENLRHTLKRLVREGRIVREGGGFHPVELEASVQ